MIELVSLLLGLVTGVKPIDLHVVGPVARVEVQLDGETIAELEGPPWSFDHDFGPRLMPHDLVAIAYDASGRELDRTTHWINLDQSTSRADLALIPDDEGKPAAIRISWESIGQLQPQQISVDFDGIPLSFDHPRHIPLPRYDLADFHFVTAQLLFADGTSSFLQAGFGGVLGDQLQTELTAVVVEKEKGRIPDAEDLEGWFEARGRPLQVHGVEKGKAQLVIVRDPSIQPQLDALAWYLQDRSRPGANRKNRTAFDLTALLNSSQGDKSSRPTVRGIRGSGGVSQRLRQFASLGTRAFVRFVSPESATLAPEGVLPEIFLHSPSFSSEDHSFASLTLLYPPQRFEVRFGDAIALAGMLAHASHGRRGVLLLLGDGSVDTSLYPKDLALEYLRHLGVPFHVARFNGGGHPEWNDVLDLGSLEKPSDAERQFARVVEDLSKQLDRQRTIWLVGRHLPQDIRLGPKAKGIRLVGR